MASVVTLLAVAACALAAGGLVGWGVTWGVMRSTDGDVEEPLPPPPPPPPAELRELDWWESTVLYQIYPRSFKDSDGDGIGDLRGIMSELENFIDSGVDAIWLSPNSMSPIVAFDYDISDFYNIYDECIMSELEHFVESGVDAIWLSPIFTSPMVDFGYDISDFYDIHDEYGTMADFEELVERVHELGLKILLDFVPNHASTESEYFLKSLRREEGFEDFFVWDDGLPDPANPDGRPLPPSNWVSQFGGSAWEWSDERNQYYLHQFAVEQADFNFRNPAVRQEMIEIMRFWMDKGADGFRVDALPYMYEADKADHGGFYPDDPLSGFVHYEPGDLGYTIPIYTKDLIELYDVIYEWRTFVDEWSAENGGSTRAMLTEGYANVSMTMLYYGDEAGREGAHFPFNFDFITDLDADSSARDFVYVILRWLTYMPHGGVPNWVFGNHDNNRMPSRFRPEMVDGLNALNMMLPGVAVTYQGEEIGMRDGNVTWEQTVDVQACNMGTPEDYHLWSRDPARTPFHWDSSTSAGFSTSEDTWLPVSEDYLEINLAAQREAARSHYNVYKALTTLRREETLRHGEYDIRALTDGTLALVRTLSDHDTLALVFNVGETQDTVYLDRVSQLPENLEVYISSVHSARLPGTTVVRGELALSPGEALVLRAPTT